MPTHSFITETDLLLENFWLSLQPKTAVTVSGKMLGCICAKTNTSNQAKRSKGGHTATTAGSHDLSELFEGALTVTVSGCETHEIVFAGKIPLSKYAQEAAKMAGQRVVVPDPTNSPWTVVSYDRAQRELNVK